jgi:hypothetical protein
MMGTNPHPLKSPSPFVKERGKKKKEGLAPLLDSPQSAF